MSLYWTITRCKVSHFLYSIISLGLLLITLKSLFCALLLCQLWIFFAKHEFIRISIIYLMGFWCVDSLHRKHRISKDDLMMLLSVCERAQRQWAYHNSIGTQDECSNIWMLFHDQIVGRRLPLHKKPAKTKDIESLNVT